MTNLVASKEVQTLLDRASGICEAGGNARLKAIMRDFLESTMSLIESMTSPRANSGRRSTICRIARRNSNSSSQGLASNIFSIFTWMQRMRLQACRVAHRGRSRGRSTLPAHRLSKAAQTISCLRRKQGQSRPVGRNSVGSARMDRRLLRTGPKAGTSEPSFGGESALLKTPAAMGTP